MHGASYRFSAVLAVVQHQNATHTPERTNRKENRTARLVWGELGGGGGGVRHVPRGDAELECFDYFISLKLGLERECDKNVIMSSLTLAHSQHVTNVDQVFR